MAEGVSTDFTLTTAEVVEKIKRQPSGTSFYVRIRFDSPIVDKPERIFPGLQSLKISRAETLKLAKDAVGGVIEERGGRVRCTEYVSENGGRTYRAFYLH